VDFWLVKSVLDPHAVWLLWRRISVAEIARRGWCSMVQAGGFRFASDAARSSFTRARANRCAARLAVAP
jgi:hypothetical protein